MGNTQSEEHQKQLFQQKITPYGGVLIHNKNDLLFDFSNSGIEFQTLSKISFQIDFLTNDIMGQDAIFFGGHVYVKIFIDGECQHKLRITPKSTEEERRVTIEKNKRVKIVKVSEALLGIVCVRNILSLPIQSVPKEEKVKVEFIGASLVSGYGNDHEDNKLSHADWQKTWCYHLCQHYNWEAMVHSYSGMGLVKNAEGVRENQITERRRRIIGYDKESKFDFSTFKASYVFMNIGTNDFAGRVKEPLKTEFLEKMKQLIYELQENYGKNVKVGIVHGPMMNEPVRDVIREIPELFNDDLDTKKNVSILSTYLSDKEEDKDLYRGPCFHPTELGHKVMADQIIEQLDKIGFI